MPKTALVDAERVRELVLQTLTKRERLRGEKEQLTEVTVLQDGQIRGIHYSLRGPRDMLLTAIWDAQTHTLWCYDSRGRRFAQKGLGR